MSKKITLSLVALIFVSVIALGVTWLCLNWNTLTSGSNLYTKEQLEESYNKGQSDALKNEIYYNELINSLYADLEEYQLKLGNLGTSYEDKKAEVLELNANIEILNRQIEELNTTNSENKTLIESLRADKKTLEETLSIKVIELEEATLELGKLTAKVDALNILLDGKNTEITRLQNELNAIRSQISEDYSEAYNRGYEEAYNIFQDAYERGYSDGYAQLESEYIASRLWDGNIDKNWYLSESLNTYDESLQGYVITRPQQFAGLSALIEEGNTFENKAIYIINDLYFNDINLVLGEDTSNLKEFSATIGYFKGKVYGGNSTIYGIYAQNRNSLYKRYSGIFGELSGAEINNLNFKYINSTLNGIIAGKINSNSKLVGVNISNAIYDKGVFTSTIEAATNIEFINCSSNVVNKNSATASGFVTNVTNSSISFKNCINYSNLTVSTNLGRAAGFIAQVSTSFINFEDCRNEGNISSIYATSSYDVGGFVGFAYLSTGSLTFINCVNAGNLTMISNSTNSNGFGSLFGRYESSNSNVNELIIIENCNNIGELSKGGVSLLPTVLYSIFDSSKNFVDYYCAT